MASIQFDYQAEQLLINKMVILFKDQEQRHGERLSPRSTSLTSLRGARHRGGAGKGKSAEAEDATDDRSPEIGELRRESPARRSLLVRKGGAEAGPQWDPLRGRKGARNGERNGDNQADKKDKKSKAGGGGGGFLGLLTSKNKKNKATAASPPQSPTGSLQKLPPLSPTVGVQKLPPLQRPAGKQDSKLEVRRALAAAAEAQRMRQQQGNGQGQHQRLRSTSSLGSGASTPTSTTSPVASPIASPVSDAGLSLAQRQARLDAQAKQTQSLLEDMHAQQVQQMSPPATPRGLKNATSPPPIPSGLKRATSPPPTPSSLKSASSPPPTPSSMKSTTSPPSTPSTPSGPEARRMPSALSGMPSREPPSTPTWSPPATPTQSATPRSPPSTPGTPVSLEFRGLSPAPRGGQQGLQSTALLQAERQRRDPSPPLSPTLSQLDGSPGQRRRALAERIARTPSPSPAAARAGAQQAKQAQQAPRSPEPAAPPARQQGRRAGGPLAKTPPAPSPQQQDDVDDGAGLERTSSQRRSGRRGLGAFFLSLTKRSSSPARQAPPPQQQPEPRPAQQKSPPQENNARPKSPAPASAAQDKRPQIAAPKPSLPQQQQQPSQLRGPASPPTTPRSPAGELGDMALLYHQQLVSQERSASARDHRTTITPRDSTSPPRDLTASPRSPTVSLSYSEASGRATPPPSHRPTSPDRPGTPRQGEAATTLSRPKLQQVQQGTVQPPQQQLRPEVQRTEQLLHAERFERTDQKPPLPRGAAKQTAKQAAPSSDKKADSQQDGKTYCQSCKKKCSGEVLRVQDKYFHIACFKCKVCRNSLAQGGFFCKDGAYYCTSDYQRQFGTKCAVCGEYVEGEVVAALGNTYHQKCFTCGRCRQAFPSGERVTYTGKEVLCARCVQIPVRTGHSGDERTPAVSPTSAGGAVPGSNECAGCHEELKECQALIALDRQWHIWCFKCKACDAVLHGEYMGKDGVPYCEKDYQKKFGVKCAYCSRYISGKVLQAGDNHHFHPTCARCTKCGDPFGDGEEMYLQGGAIWHPRCGPGPTENGAILNGGENGHCTDTETEAESGRDTAFDRMSSSAVSDMQFSIRSRTPSLNGSFNSLSRKYQYPRTSSPGLILREYNKHQYPEDISRIYTYSYLTEEPTQGYLKRPIDPYDKPPTSPHFHRPSSAASGRGSKLGHLSSKHGSRTGMTVLVDAIRSETPRPRSPHMNNEEPIELAHFPAAKPPQPGEAPKIEREDFPAPPYPYTDPERRRRWSDTYKGVPISDDEDENDGKSEKQTEDRKLQREEKELSKIATGIGKVFLHNVREREKLNQWKRSHMDPRNASRTPSASREPTYRLRYQSPVNASPSRNVDHPRPWEEEELMDRSSSYRSSVGRSTGAIPSYNVVSSLRSPPKPGYGLRSCTLPAAGRNGGFMGYSTDQGDYSFSGLGEKTHSTEFSSGKSDISAGSISEVDRRALAVELPVSTTYTGGLGALRSASYSPHLRRSLPNMNHSNSTEPPKIYPYHLLVITNYRLPADVDRCNLERHLSDAEFDGLFGCSRVEFYRLPQWKRNELKRRVRLF